MKTGVLGPITLSLPKPYHRVIVVRKIGEKNHISSAQGGCLLWGDRVVIPEKLREKVLELLHEGHPGIVRMKGLARSYVWWPLMDTEIAERVGKCQACQESRPLPPTAPIREWERPQGPWSRIHIDFAGPFHGQTFLVVVDAYSKWLEIILMRSMTAEAVISVLRHLFVTHGLPDTLVSDNGPQFTATQFEGYLAEEGIRHVLSAPFHPATNGLAERFVRSAKEALSRIRPGDWQTKIDTFLAVQHRTPCVTTGRSPAELLMGRKLRCPLDRLNPNYTPDGYKGAHGKTRGMAVGDLVWAHNYSEGPTWLAGKILEITGPKSYLVEIEDGRVWKRHIDQIRKRITGKSESDETGPDYPMFESTADSNPGQTRDLSEFQEVQRRQPVPPEDSRDDSANNPGPDGLEEELRGTNSPSGQLDSLPENELRRSERVRRRPVYLRDYVEK
ncbi:uncharacterized protein K02A2.6-like [Ahaetulla prasina]|uniref:uncharacterized protein K02A2.6-like n=1 Tax=Ahaetulla prasina TaxID=499056 RepID=UPI0026483D01|nr:uncharacterized protein K02A2.6-like [Ahaetulla prasina]